MSELSDVLEEERQAALVAAQPPVMVYVRVRPLLEHELRKGSKYVWEQNASNTTLRMKKSSSASGGGSASTSGGGADFDAFTSPVKAGKLTQQFTFDRVFGAASTNDELFIETTRPLVRKVMAGFNGCLFAYGQTGSGKTWSVLGDGHDHLGLMPAAVREVFEQIRREDDYEFLLRVSYLEVYNETVNDLLVPEDSALWEQHVHGHQWQRVSGTNAQEVLESAFQNVAAGRRDAGKFTIALPSEDKIALAAGKTVLWDFNLTEMVMRERVGTTRNVSKRLRRTPNTGQGLRILAQDPTYGAVVKGLTEEIVSSPEEIVELVRAGEETRHYGSHGMNEKSSRSHTIFRLVIESRKTAEAIARDEEQLGRLSPSHNTEELVALDDDGFTAADVTGKDAKKGKTMARVSILNIVDLAGSECLEKIYTPDEAKGKNMSLRCLIREGHHINKSLLSLKKVIGALAKQSARGEKAEARASRRPSVSATATSSKKAALKTRLSKGKSGAGAGQQQSRHIGYRNSKLTQLLQMSLGGNCFTTVLCTMSPAALQLDETVSTLRFGLDCKKMKNAVKRNVVESSKTIIRKFKLRVAALQSRLEAREAELEREKAATAARAALPRTRSKSTVVLERERIAELATAQSAAAAARQRTRYLEEQLKKMKDMVVTSTSAPSYRSRHRAQTLTVAPLVSPGSMRSMSMPPQRRGLPRRASVSVMSGLGDRAQFRCFVPVVAATSPSSSPSSSSSSFSAVPVLPSTLLTTAEENDDESEDAATTDDEETVTDDEENDENDANEEEKMKKSEDEDGDPTTPRPPLMTQPSPRRQPPVPPPRQPVIVAPIDLTLADESSIEDGTGTGSAVPSYDDGGGSARRGTFFGTYGRAAVSRQRDAELDAMVGAVEANEAMAAAHKGAPRKRSATSTSAAAAPKLVFRAGLSEGEKLRLALAHVHRLEEQYALSAEHAQQQNDALRVQQRKTDTILAMLRTDAARGLSVADRRSRLQLESLTSKLELVRVWWAPPVFSLLRLLSFSPHRSNILFSFSFSFSDDLAPRDRRGARPLADRGE